MRRQIVPPTSPVIPSAARNLRPKGALVHRPSVANRRARTDRRQRRRDIAIGSASAASPRRFLAPLEMTIVSLAATGVWRPYDPTNDRSPLLRPGRDTL